MIVLALVLMVIGLVLVAILLWRLFTGPEFTDTEWNVLVAGVIIFSIGFVLLIVLDSRDKTSPGYDFYSPQNVPQAVGFASGSDVAAGAGSNGDAL